MSVLAGGGRTVGIDAASNVSCVLKTRMEGSPSSSSGAASGAVVPATEEERSPVRRLAAMHQAAGLPVFNPRYNVEKCSYSVSIGDDGEDVMLISKASAGSWCETMAMTMLPLIETPIVFKSRPAYGFEVEVEKEAPGWAGYMEIGLTTSYVGASSRPTVLRSRPCTLTVTESGCSVLDRSTRSQGLGDLTTRPSKPIGSRMAVMIFTDVSPPMFTVFHDDDVALSSPLSEVLSKLQLPEGTAGLSQLYGCLELYGQTDAVYMKHDRMVSVATTFDPSLYTTYWRGLQDVLRVLFNLTATESVVSLLPREVLFIVCHYVLVNDRIARVNSHSNASSGPPAPSPSATPTTPDAVFFPPGNALDAPRSPPSRQRRKCRIA